MIMEITYPQRHAELQSLLGCIHEGGPTSTNGCRAHEALEQFEARAAGGLAKVNA